jgi:hypothetical protein
MWRYDLALMKYGSGIIAGNNGSGVAAIISAQCQEPSEQ